MSANEAKLYKQAKNVSSGSTNKFYFSKSAKSLPIEEIKISAGTPCWNQAEVARAPNQSHYFAEMLSTVETCTLPNPDNYQKLNLGSG